MSDLLQQYILSWLTQRASQVSLAWSQYFHGGETHVRLCLLEIIELIVAIFHKKNVSYLQRQYFLTDVMSQTCGNTPMITTNYERPPAATYSKLTHRARQILLTGPHHFHVGETRRECWLDIYQSVVTIGYIRREYILTDTKDQQYPQIYYYDHKTLWAISVIYP